MSYYPPPSPFDPTNPGSLPKRQRSVNFAQEKELNPSTRSHRSNSTSSRASTVSTTRKARFAEATSVISPAAGPGEKRSPFADPPNMADSTAYNPVRPSDFGFGYISDNNPVEQHATVPTNLHPNGQPLKSALKTPGTSTRLVDPLNPLKSPTFREEAMLEREEEKTDKKQASDLKVKARVRLAKIILRGVSFACSLIVLSMLSTVLTIFRTTRALPNRNGSPAWAAGSSAWPQITVLTIACVSLALSVVVIFAYCRGGHRRAEKAGVYYTMFAVASFIFSIIMWLIGAAVLQGTKANGNGVDVWGWSCKDNKRRALFKDDIDYALMCRLQDWSLICCIIEIIVEIMVISIYGVVFYRFYTKNKLRKSMDVRDRARSDLYLAQLRAQSAPNTPGYATTPRNPSFFPSHINTDTKHNDYYAPREHDDSPTQYVSVTPTSAHTTSAFKLQPAPSSRTTPKMNQDGFEMATTPPMPQQPVRETSNAHVQVAPGEQVYEAVPIPGAYAQVHKHH